MRLELCVPCAVKLAETRELKKTAHRRNKLTCAECRRRRYGSEYEVGRRIRGADPSDKA